MVEKIGEAVIYKPAKTAMQSGTAKTKSWILEYAPEDTKFVDGLMGWTGSKDTKQQIRLFFATKEEAIQFATHNGITYELREPHHRSVKPKSYAENFIDKE